MKSKHTLVTIGITFFFSVLAVKTHAQQDSQYTQYMYNTIMINPAYAGSRGLLSANMTYRAQWVGVNGAPNTFAGSVNTPIGVKNVGLGISAFNDQLGPSTETFVSADFSYTIKVTDIADLSFGLKAGFNVLDVNLQGNPDLNYTYTDPNVVDVNSRFSPTFGAGLYLHADKWYVGFSAPSVLKTEHYEEDRFKQSNVTEEMHLYLIAGYVFDLSSTLQFKPAVLAKSVEGSPLALDVSANFLFNKKFTLGAAWRWDATVSGLAGYQITDQLMLGYAYDYDISDFVRYNNGSHEIFLRFELNKSSNRRVINPRFF